jgi:hypothetical protein
VYGDGDSEDRVLDGLAGEAEDAEEEEEDLRPVNASQIDIGTVRALRNNKEILLSVTRQEMKGAGQSPKESWFCIFKKKLKMHLKDMPRL